MFSFYKIKNNLDGYSYIGTTAHSISSRICSHLEKYYLFLNRWENKYNQCSYICDEYNSLIST